ncbi:MAG: hypothetical protein C4326_07225 [Ignavibacteria bacterium]
MLAVSVGNAQESKPQVMRKNLTANDGFQTSSPRSEDEQRDATPTGADINIASSIFLTIGSDAVLTLGGDLINNGTLSAGAGSTVEFNGTDAQSLSGATTLENLKKSGGGLLTLGSPVTVNGTLTLTSGLIQLGFNTLTIGSSGSISGDSSSSYIVTNGTGGLMRNGVGASARSFPIGPTPGSYNPVTITNSGTPDDFSASVKTTFDVTPPQPDRVVNRQWTIMEAVAGGSNATLVFQWNINEQAVGFSTASPIVIGQHKGTQWNEVPATLDGSNPYTATAANFTSFSLFSVGNTGALPVQISSFTGQAMPRRGVVLRWTTISEINNYEFYIQRRAHAVSTFTELPNSFVPGHGTTNVPQHYDYHDSSVAAGSWFYRLRQVDLDGSVHFTDAIHVDVLTGVHENVPLQFALFQYYPNPFNPSTEIRFTVDVSAHTTLDVYNLLGQKLATLFDDLAGPGQYYTVRLDASRLASNIEGGLASGVYLYRLQCASRTSIKKLIIVK